jgi:hypothetical protein
MVRLFNLFVSASRSKLKNPFHTLNFFIISIHWLFRCIATEIPDQDRKCAKLKEDFDKVSESFCMKCKLSFQLLTDCNDFNVLPFRCRRRPWSLQQCQGCLHEAETSHAVGEEARQSRKRHEKSRSPLKEKDGFLFIG